MTIGHLTVKTEHGVQSKVDLDNQTWNSLNSWSCSGLRCQKVVIARFRNIRLVLMPRVQVKTNASIRNSLSWKCVQIMSSSFSVRRRSTCSVLKLLTMRLTKEQCRFLTTTVGVQSASYSWRPGTMVLQQIWEVILSTRMTDTTQSSSPIPTDMIMLTSQTRSTRTSSEVQRVLLIEKIARNSNSAWPMEAQRLSKTTRVKNAWQN